MSMLPKDLLKDLQFEDRSEYWCKEIGKSSTSTSSDMERFQMMVERQRQMERAMARPLGLSLGNMFGNNSSL